MADEKKAEPKVEPKVEQKSEPKVEPKAKKADGVDAFIERKLKVINKMPDGKKKTRAAERILRNKEAK